MDSRELACLEQTIACAVQDGIREGMKAQRLDLFAASVAQGMLASFADERGWPEPADVAKQAYRYADALAAEGARHA
jgi:hypothetical protein